ncbi:hypothetical protein [Butyrivibrio sp. VCD2006]|uniref:hypothetical protein n=1 Tax=Butyrivibrio sp. VCD2006 TaxID=1280664 RepID=UPI0003F6AE8B|nr:hypothetical protein [Butyrivibrio sp. VCD2006]
MQEEIDRALKSKLIENTWIVKKNMGWSIRSFFTDNKISHVAIYGLGALGLRLYDDLEDSGLKIDYAIDQTVTEEKQSMVEFPLLSSSSDSFPQTELIIVTPVQYYWDIVKLLEQKTDIPIVSLEDVVAYG